MFKKFIELVKEALHKMFGYKDISQTMPDVDMFDVSEAMKEAVDEWKAVYKDESPWLDDEEGVYSLQLGKAICQSMQTLVLSEMESTIKGDSKRAEFLDKQWQKHFIDKLPENLEVGMALGGLVMKPYVSENKIYIDFCRQGTFVPIAYNDDGDITDIAFPDIMVKGDSVFTRIERHTFDSNTNTVVVENKAYIAKNSANNGNDTGVIDTDGLGKEVPLESVPRWSSIKPIVKMENVERPLYGYYRVPLANNIDLNSPLGISIFSPALKMIRRCDEQFSRLDWEYEGGMMAIDVDMTALKSEFNETSTYFGGATYTTRQDRLRDRLYRSVDLNSDDTYHEFAPSLRDTNYQNGLNKYLTRVEDLVGLARGSLSDEIIGDSRTATEMKMLKQRTFITVSAHQKALDKAFEDLLYAMDKYVDLFKLEKPGKCELSTIWKDSILTDTQEEMNQRIQMLHEGVEAKWETRMWWKDEDEETAKEAIAEIEEGEEQELDDDIFSQNKLLSDNPFNEKE